MLAFRPSLRGHIPRGGEPRDAIGVWSRSLVLDWALHLSWVASLWACHSLVREVPRGSLLASPPLWAL